MFWINYSKNFYFKTVIYKQHTYQTPSTINKSDSRLTCSLFTIKWHKLTVGGRTQTDSTAHDFLLSSRKTNTKMSTNFLNGVEKRQAKRTPGDKLYSTHTNMKLKHFQHTQIQAHTDRHRRLFFSIAAVSWFFVFVLPRLEEASSSSSSSFSRGTCHTWRESFLVHCIVTNKPGVRPGSACCICAWVCSADGSTVRFRCLSQSWTFPGSRESEILRKRLLLIRFCFHRKNIHIV